MIETEDIQKEVSARVKNIIESSPNANLLITQLKKTIMSAVSKGGITVDESIDVAARMIVLAALVK